MAVKRTKKTEPTTEKVVVNTDEEKVVDTPVETAEVEVKEPVEESTEGSEKTADEITFDPAKVDNSVESTEKKKVRVRLKDKYHCNVGGTFYNFEKGQCYNVPENVKMVLARVDMLDIL